MVAIVSGSSLGLNLSSLASLGGHGQIGTASQGRNGESAFVNVSSGNLVLRDLDGLLVGVGANVATQRTYNSQGISNFTNDDGWRIGQYKSVVVASGNTLQRTDSDGSRASYAWDASSQSYLATNGAGSAVNSIQSNSDGSYTWTSGATGATERYAGTGSGLIQSSSDTSGNMLAFQYDGGGLLTKVTDADGESVNYAYEGQNLVAVSTTLQSGETLDEVTYTYDAQNRLTSVSVNLDPSGNLPSDSEMLSNYVTDYTYDGTSDRIASITQSDGTSLSFTYVQTGGAYRVASVTDGLGNLTSFAYNVAANTTTVTDPLGASSVYSYDSKGQLTEVRDGVTAANSSGLSQLSYVYNDLGDVSAMTDGAGHTVQMQYDARGNLTSQVDAAGDTHTWTYNAVNQVQTSTVYATSTDPAGAVAAGDPEATRYVYAASNPTQLRFVVSPEGDVAEYRYNASGQRTSALTYATGTFDITGLGATAVPSEAQMSTWTVAQDPGSIQRLDMAYDFRGQLQSSTTYAGVDASGAGLPLSALITQYVYDQRGELLQSIEPGAQGVTTYVYDGLGRLVSVSAPSLDGSTPNLSLTSYDDANGSTTLTLSNGLSTISTYDHAGRLVSVVQSADASALGTTSYSYDADGHLLMTQDPTGVRHWMMYDAEGRKVADIAPTGTLTEYVYNQGSQLSETIVYATAVDTVQLVDTNGAPLTAWGSVLDLSTLRPTSSPQDAKVWNFYDSANRLTWQVDALGYVTETSYDGASRVLAVTRLATPIDVSQLVPGASIGLAPRQETTSVALSVNNASAVAGTPAVLTAEVAGTDSSGMVTFFSGTTVLGSAMVTNGQATLTTDRLTSGLNHIRAIYSGDDVTPAGASAVVDKTITPIQTDLSLTFSGASSSYGDAVTISADLTNAGTLVPTGTVAFYNGSVLIGTATLVNGVASLTVSTLPVGSLNIHAEYAGDALHTSANAQHVFVVNPPPVAAPPLSLSASASVSSGGPVTLQAQFSGTDSGYITFFAGTHYLGTVSASTGNNNLVVDFLPAGTYNWSATFSRFDNQFSPVVAQGGTTNIEVNQTGNKPVWWDAESPDGVDPGESDDYGVNMYEASVPGSIMVGLAPTVHLFDRENYRGLEGTYSFFLDGTLVGSIVNQGDWLDQYTTELPIALTASNAHELTVVYRSKPSGNYGDFFSSFSMSFGVLPAHSEIALSASPATTPAGSPITLHASVAIAPPAAGVGLVASAPLAGTVTFYSNGQAIGAANVVDGVATLAVADLQQGTDNITASYSGDANYLAANSSSAFQVTVTAAPIAPLTNLTAASINPDGFLSVRVNGVTPTGLVSFYEGLTLLGTATVVNGVASLSNANLPPGTHTFTAAYAGDANNVESDTSFTQVVTGTPSNHLLVTPDAAYDRTTTDLYDRDGRLQASIDGEGYLTQYRYDRTGRLVETIGYANPVPGFTSAASIATVLAEARSSHDMGALVPADSSNDIHAYTYYNARGQVVGQVDGDGYLSEMVYDANGNVAQIIRYAVPAAAMSSISTLAQIRPASSPQDQVVTQTWNAANELTSRTGVDGTVTTFAYDSVGHLLQSTTALDTADQRTLTERYDVQGHLTAELSPNGAALLTGNETPDQIDAIWAQYATTYTYDAAGRRTSTTDAVGDRTVFFYDDAGRLRYTVDALGQTIENVYDALGHLSSTTRYAIALDAASIPGLQSLQDLQGGLLSAEANQATATALADTKTASAQNGAENSTTSYAYDADGNQPLVTNALGGTTALHYNAFGEVIDSIQTLNDTQSVSSGNHRDRRGLIDIASAGEGATTATTYTWYDAFGRVIQSRDANGNLNSATYDAVGRVISTSDAYMVTRTTTYDAFGRTLTQTNAFTGATTSYAYDTAARSVSLTTPGGIVLTTVHTREGLTQSVTDGNGNTTSYQYDADGNLLSTITPQTTISNEYDAADRLTVRVDANGNRVAYTYDAANRLLTQTLDPDGLNLVTRYAYDAKGEKISATDPNGTVTSFSYDAAGEILTQTVDPDGLALTTSYAYDKAGHTVSVTTPAGTLTEYAYDDLGRRIQMVVDPAGLALTTSYSYDPVGNMVAKTDADGNLTRYAYDQNNRVSDVVDGAGNVTHYTYDSDSRIVATIQYATPINLDGLAPDASAGDIEALVVAAAALDVTQHNVYDWDGRLTWTVDGTGAVTNFVYDGAGNVVSRTRFETRIDLSTWTPGSPPSAVWNSYGDLGQDEVTRTVYDSLNRAIYTIDGVGAVTALTYDANGNVIDRITYANTVFPGTQATKTALDDAVAGIAQADDAHIRAVYDAANRLTWSVDGTGAVTHNAYDADGRVTSQTRFATAVAAGAPPEDVATSDADRRTDMLYDTAGRMVYQMRWTDRSDQMADAGDMRFVTSYAYDGDGRLIRQTAHVLPLDSYVSSDLLDVASSITVSVQDRSQYMAYDAAGRMIYGVDAAGGITQSTYDGVGNVIASTRYAKAAQTLPPGDYGMSAYTLPGLSASAISTLIDRDVANDRTSLAAFDGAGRKTYSVDALGYVSHLTYDGAGRITTSTQYATAVTAAGALSIGATAGTIAGALNTNSAADRTDSFSYDAAGNLIASTDALGHTESYVYNGLGEKTTFTNKLGASWSYAYDAAGRMITEYAPDPSGSEFNAYYGGLHADAQTVMTYDALGNLTSRTEGYNTPDSRTTSYVYDAMGRQISTIYPAVAVYDPQSDHPNDAFYGGAYGSRSETWVTPTSHVAYDAFGDAVANVDVAGNISIKAYDKLGQLLYDVDALGYVTGYVRNDFGDVIALTRYASNTGSVPGVSYQGSDVPSARQIEYYLAPSAADRTISTTYDRLGRAVRVTQPATWVNSGGGQSYETGAVTTTTYNAFGEVLQSSALADLPSNTWATSTFYYDRRGQQVASIDALGFLTTQAYDAAGNNTRVTQFANAVSASTLDSYTAAESDANDRTMVFGYDRLNRRTSQTQVNVSYSAASDGSFVTGNLSTTYGYDALGNNTRTTDALGNSTYTYYDAAGRIRAVVAPASDRLVPGQMVAPLTEFQRDVLGNVVQKIEYGNGVISANEAGYQAYEGSGPASRVTRTGYDTHGNAIQVTDAGGVDHYMSYDVSGHLAKAWQTLDDGSVLYTLFEYDALGRQTAIVTPASTSVVNDGIVVESQSEAGSITTGMAWNAFGEMVQRGNYATGSTAQYQESFEYDDAGHLWRTNSGDGNFKIALYNLQGQQTSQIVSAGSQGSTADLGVDLAGIANAQAADALGNIGVRRTDSQRDLLGRVLTQTLPSRMDGTDAASYRPVVYQEYDRWGNVVRQSDVRNASWVTQYTYNANNQVILQKQPNGNGALSDDSPITQIYYDALGRQVAIRDADGHVNGQVWDGNGHLVTELHADGGVVNHLYNALGDQTVMVDAMGNTTEYEYDNLGRNTLIAHDNVGVYAAPAGGGLVGIVGGVQSLFVRTSYDNAGRKTWQGDGTDTGGMRYTYDLRGNVITATDADGFVTSFAYDAQGRKIASEDANGSLATWSYDSFGELTGHTDIGGASYGFTYDNARQLIAQTNTRGQNLAYAYDAAGQLTNIADGAIDQQTYYAYNAAGQRVLEQTVQAGVTYQNQVDGYDTLGRLSLVSGMDGVTLTTDYDKVGNKLHQHVTYTTLQPHTVIDYANVQATDESGNPIFHQVQTGTQTVQTGTTLVQTGTQTVQIGTQQVITGYDEANNPIYTTVPIYGEVPVYTAVPVYSEVPVYTNEPVYVQQQIGTHLVNDTIAHAQDLFYAYDAMNRQTLADGAVNSDANNLANLTLGQGHLLAYDRNGNRIQDRAWGTAVIPQYVQNYDESSGTSLGAPVLTGYTSQQAIQTQWYSYDAMNRLSKVSTGAYGQVQTGTVQTGVDESTNDPIYSPVYTTQALGQDQAITLDTRFYDGASRVIQSGPAGSLPSAYLAALTQGNVDVSGATTTTTRYDAAGRVITQQVFNEADLSRSYTTYFQRFAPTNTPGPFDAPAVPGASGYDEAGNLLGYRLVRASGGDFIVETHVLNQQKLDTYKELSETVLDVNTSSGNSTFDISSMSYDANGFLTGVTDATAPANSRTLFNDAQGHVLMKDQLGQLHQLVANGEVLGIYGQTLNQQFPSFPDGTPNFTVTGNFDLAYQPVTNSYPAAATGSYPVQSGDTLKGIAQSAYGDSSLWYLIADANGLSGDSDLRVGQILNIPTKVGGVHNSSSTYAPYEPGRIVGSTGPQLPTPAGRQDDDGCGIGQIIVAVVAVVVTVITEGATSEWASESVFSAAATEGATAETVGAAASLAGTVETAGAFVAGALGSIAGQAVGNIIGTQNGFSWKQVALGALGNGISSAVGAGDGLVKVTGSPTASAVANKAIGNALTQAAAVTLGLQDHFNWTQVAASAAGAGVSTAIGRALNSANAFSGLGDFGASVVRGTVSGFAGGFTTSTLKGGRVNATQVATDAFGNALGSSLAAAHGQQAGSSSSSDDPLGALIALNDGWAGVSATPTFAEDHAMRSAALNPGGLPTYSPSTAADGLNARNGSDVQDDAYVVQHGPGIASTRLNVQSGDTVEGLAKQLYGDDWRAGVAVLMSANNLRTNQWGSPTIRAGGTLLAPSLDGVSSDLLGALSSAGGSIEANNTVGLNQKALLEAQAAQRAAQAASNYNVNYGNEGRNYFLSGAGAKLDYQQQVYNAQETYRFGANSAALQASAQATADWNDAAINASLGDANPMAYQLESDSTRGKFITGFASALWKGATELPLEVTDTVTAAWNVLRGDDKYVGYSILGQKAMGGASGWELAGDVGKNVLSVLPPIGVMRGAYNLTEAIEEGDPSAAGAAVAGIGGSLLAAKVTGYEPALLSENTASSIQNRLTSNAQRGSATVEFLTGGLLPEDASTLGSAAELTTLSVQRRLAQVTATQRDALLNDPELLAQNLKRGEMEAIAEDPWRMRLFFGTALQRRVNIIAADDPLLSSIKATSGNAPQDYINSNGYGYDITGSSRQSILSHAARPGINSVVTYESIPNNFGYQWLKAYYGE